MKPGHVLRVARPTDSLRQIAGMYVNGLGFAVLGEFTGHSGFDGVILGHPEQPYHIEFTTHRGHTGGRAPSEDSLLVFYVPDETEWRDCCEDMISAGFKQVPAYNSYWDVNGRTFEDTDGYRVVIQRADWTR